jgi:hypothetical protein
MKAIGNKTAWTRDWILASLCPRSAISALLNAGFGGGDFFLAEVVGVSITTVSVRLCESVNMGTPRVSTPACLQTKPGVGQMLQKNFDDKMCHHVP